MFDEGIEYGLQVTPEVSQELRGFDVGAMVNNNFFMVHGKPYEVVPVASSYVNSNPASIPSFQ